MCEAFNYKNVNGMYRLNRLPFRIKAAPGVFQQIMDMLLNDVDFPIACLDDILIRSESQEQNAKYVKEIYEKIKQMA